MFAAETKAAITLSISFSVMARGVPKTKVDVQRAIRLLPKFSGMGLGAMFLAKKLFFPAQRGDCRPGWLLYNFMSIKLEQI